MEPRIYCDTRQQRGHHLNVDRWLARHQIAFSYKKLDFGDYMTADGASNIAVDTKKDMQELAGNLGREHARFSRELNRARDAGFRLYILVEEHPEYADRDLVETWTSRVCRGCGKCDPLRDKCTARKSKPMNGPTMRRIIDRIEDHYGARFAWCSRKDTARTICELLGVKYG